MRYASWATLVVVVVASATGLGAARAGDVAGGAKQEAEKTVTVLRDDDCGSSAVARIKAVASELGLNIQVVEVIVSTQEQAAARRYLGSPTIQIKGKDLDPKARARTSYFLG